MNPASDKETTDGSFWASTTENEEDSEETDSSEDVPAKPLLIPRSDSQESSSVSFRSECSDSEHNSTVNRKREKKFSVQLITPEKKYGISVNASDTQMFIKRVRDKATPKCQGRDIECLLLEIDKDNHIPLEEDNLEFSFLQASGKIVTVKVQCSPIKHKAKSLKHITTMVTGVKRDSGK